MLKNTSNLSGIAGSNDSNLLGTEYLIALIVLTLSFFASASSRPLTSTYTADACNKALKQLAEGRLPQNSLSIAEEVVGKSTVSIPMISWGKARVKASQVFGTKENLIIGINRSAHAYVVARDVRFDGNKLPATNYIDGYSDLLDEGIFFRISVTSASIDKAIALMSGSGASGLNCVGSACDLLENSTGLNLNLRFQLKNLPSIVVKELLIADFKSNEGHKIQVQAYLFNSSLGDLFRSYYRVQAQEIATLVLLTGAAIGLPLLKIRLILEELAAR